jgi:uncharacterized lipoprotein YehR (DUF1307 family)
MKNIFKLIGIIAIAAVIGFSMTACGGDDGDDLQTATYTGTADGQTYTLKITENPSARYVVQIGDNYILFSGSQKSIGTVISVSGDTLTLKPSRAGTESFSAIVSGSDLTSVL